MFLSLPGPTTKIGHLGTEMKSTNIKPQSQVKNYNKAVNRFTSHRTVIKKAHKKACLARELVHECIAISLKDFAKAAKCSKKTAARDLQILMDEGIFRRFMGSEKEQKVHCEKLDCEVPDRRYFYGFVLTVKETTNVVRISNTEIRNNTQKGINFLRKGDHRYELFKKSGRYVDEQLLHRDDAECKNVTTKAIKEGLLEELGKELGIPRAPMLVYVEQFVIWHRLSQSLLLDQKESIKGYVLRCKESGFENHWQFKRSLSYRVGK